MRLRIILAFTECRCLLIHCFEYPEYQYLNRSRERFAMDLSVRADLVGRCASVLIYNSQLVTLKAGHGILHSLEIIDLSLDIVSYLLSSQVELVLPHHVFAYGANEPSNALESVESAITSLQISS